MFESRLWCAAQKGVAVVEAVDNDGASDHLAIGNVVLYTTTVTVGQNTVGSVSVYTVEANRWFRRSSLDIQQQSLC